MSEGQCTICGDGQFVQWECPQCGRQIHEDDYAAGLAAGEKERKELEDVLTELLEVADLRGDSDLPHPADDPKLWTGRMQEAWDNARALLSRQA